MLGKKKEEKSGNLLTKISYSENELKMNEGMLSILEIDIEISICFFNDS